MLYVLSVHVYSCAVSESNDQWLPISVHMNKIVIITCTLFNNTFYHVTVVAHSI